MIITPKLMRWALLVCIIAMATMAFFYLRKSELSLPAFLGGGLLALFIPLLDPFLVILMHPDQVRSSQS